MKVSFRQGIVRHQTDGANNPLFLQASGSTVTLYVSPDPTIFTVTNGMAEYLYTEPTTVTSAWAGPFSPGSDYWLYWDLSLTTGLRTFGHTIFEPIEQSDAPSTPAVDQHWFNTTDRKMYVWQGNSWSERIRVFAAKYTNGTTFESMSIDAPIFTGTQVGLTMSHLSGGIAFDSNGQPIRNSNGTFFTTEDLFTAGVPEGSSLKINMIIVNAEAQEPLSAFQVVMLTDFNQIEHANPYLQGTSVFGILEEDAPTGESARMVTEGRLTNDQWDWEVAGAEANDFLYCDATGMLVLVPAIADQAPCAQILDKQTILFRPEVRTTTGTPTFSGSHGDLLDLGNDDHPQYHNDVRGDIRYYSRVELDPILTGKSDVGHTHVKVDILDFAHGHTIAEIATLQAVLDDKLSRQGDTMDASADLTFVGGEVLGLPAVPSSGDAAASKDYVDDQLSPLNAGTNITIDGSPNAINVEPQGVGSGLDADLWDGEQSNISSPANGEVLTYNAGNWENQALPTDNEGITTVQDEGSAVAGAPHDTINFVGAGVVATDGTSGVVTVTIAGGGGGSTSRIEDADGDTYVDVEETADSDTIVMGIGDNSGNFTAGTLVTIDTTMTRIESIATTSGYSAYIDILGGDGYDADGGSVFIYAGNNYYDGGSINVRSGVSTYTGDSAYAGDINIATPTVTQGYGGSINITCGYSPNRYAGEITIKAGDSGATDGGGDLGLYAGNDAGDNSPGGWTTIRSGSTNSRFSQDAGPIRIFGGASTNAIGSSEGGAVEIEGGDSASVTGYGGQVDLNGGNAYWGGNANVLAGDSTTGYGGFLNLNAGDTTGAAIGYGGLTRLRGGNSANNSGGDVQIDGGTGNGAAYEGGDVTITGGTGNTGADAGSILIQTGSRSNSASIAPTLTLDARNSDNTVASGANIELFGGNGGTGTNISGGDVRLFGGDAEDFSGEIRLIGGLKTLGGGFLGEISRSRIIASGSPNNLDGGGVFILGGEYRGAGGGISGNGGDITIEAGTGGDTTPDRGGNVTLIPGLTSGTGTRGEIITDGPLRVDGVVEFTANAKFVFKISSIAATGNNNIFHQLNHHYCIVQVYDDTVPANPVLIVPDAITLLDANNLDVDITSLGPIDMTVLVIGIA